MLKKIIIMSISFCTAFLSLEFLFFKQPQYHVWDMVYDEEIEEMDMIFIGTSLFFRDIDTPLINDAMGLRTGILACGNENLKIAVNDLKDVLKNKKVKVVVIDSCIALNGTSYPDGQSGVLIEHNDGILDVADRIMANMYEISMKKWPEAMFQICRPTLTWSRWEKEVGREMTEDFGYWPLFEKNKEMVLNNYTPEMMKKDCEKVIEKVELPDEKENIRLINKLIDIAKKNGCEVWILGMPRLDEAYARKEYGQVLNVLQLAADRGAEECIELNLDVDKIGLEVTDFRDKRHLNANGARKTTQYLIENYISPKFNSEIKYPLYAVKDEQVVDSGNMYKYMLNTYGKCYFKFTYYKNNQAEKVWESSRVNFVLLENELTNNEKLFYEISESENGDVLNSGYFMKMLE